MPTTALCTTLLAALLAVGACSSSRTAGAPSPAVSSAGRGSSAIAVRPMITIHNFGYIGGLTVRAGTKVTVLNEDSTTHTLTAKKAHAFDTGSISGDGGTETFVAPSTPGKYSFGCRFHPEMAGTLTVIP